VPIFSWCVLNGSVSNGTMKIGYFTSIEGWGGSEMYLLRMMQGIRERGHEVLLFGIKGTRLWEEAGMVGIERIAWRSIQTTDHRPQTTDPFGGTTKAQRHEWVSESNVSGLKTKAVYSLQSELKRIALKLVPGSVKLLAGNVREILHLRQLFRAHPVDVMHVNVAGIACRTAGIACVGVYCTSVVPQRSWLHRTLQHWTARSYRMIIGKSQYCLDGWLRVTGLPASRGMCVYNGIDGASITPKHPRVHRDRFRFVSVGRLHPMKGYDILIKAFAAADLPGTELVIAGDGEQRTDLEALIQSLHVAGRVQLTGHVEDVKGFLQDTDVFVLPSVSHESFGQSVIEAMAVGLPVITSDFGPLPEINVHDETGIVVSAGNANELALAIRYLYEHAEKGIRMAKSAKERANAHFKQEDMISNTIDIYMNMLSSDY